MSIIIYESKFVIEEDQLVERNMHEDIFKELKMYPDIVNDLSNAISTLKEKGFDLVLTMKFRNEPIESK